MDRALRAAFAPTIVTVRSKMNLSQEALAVAAKTTRRTIGSIERGESVAQQAVLDRILDALGMGRAEEWGEDVEVYLSMLGPLIERVPKQDRPEVMKAIVALLMETLERQPLAEVRGVEISAAP